VGALLLDGHARAVFAQARAPRARNDGVADGQQANRDIVTWINGRRLTGIDRRDH
jgi:hypothetical protein